MGRRAALPKDTATAGRSVAMRTLRVARASEVAAHRSKGRAIERLHLFTDTADTAGGKEGPRVGDGVVGAWLVDGGSIIHFNDNV